MTISSDTQGLASAMPAPARPRAAVILARRAMPARMFATGARVVWRGIPATVTLGNVPDAWCPEGHPIVSLHLDHAAARGYAPYADVRAAECEPED